MADLDERLNQLISDRESMNKVLEMAKTLLAQRDSITSGPAGAQPIAAQPGQSNGAPDLSSLLSSIITQQNQAQTPPTPEQTVSSGQNQQPQNLAMLSALLPQLMQAMSGEGSLVKRERVELLRAMRPYLKESRLSSIDRALKMANMTKAATSAMHLLGR